MMVMVSLKNIDRVKSSHMIKNSINEGSQNDSDRHVIIRFCQTFDGWFDRRSTRMYPKLREIAAVWYLDR